jgi:hypothetical protein
MSFQAQNSFEKPSTKPPGTRPTPGDDIFHELHQELDFFHDTVTSMDADPPVQLCPDSDLDSEITSLEPAFRSFVECLLASENRRRQAYKQSIIMTQKAAQSREEEWRSKERSMHEAQASSSHCSADVAQARARIQSIEEETVARITVLEEQRAALQLQMQLESCTLENQVKYLCILKCTDVLTRRAAGQEIETTTRQVPSGPSARG